MDYYSNIAVIYNITYSVSNVIGQLSLTLAVVMLMLAYVCAVTESSGLLSFEIDLLTFLNILNHIRRRWRSKFNKCSSKKVENT